MNKNCIVLVKRDGNTVRLSIVFVVFRCLLDPNEF